ncbi:MAG: hypothetical protein KF810_18015 [Rhizobiaceae bacterium]|nr:hypothetical protein [Rhizobiaceae bacterium]
MTMTRKDSLTLELHLARLEELLVPPEVSPLDGRFEDRSGVERVLDRLRAQNTRRLSAIQSRLLLDEMPDGETKRRIDAALADLGRYQDERHGEQLTAIRKDGIRALGKGLLFMLACMIVSAIAGQTTILPDLIRNLVSEGFVIAGWVALWHPMELLLYEWWPVSRDRKLYSLIAGMSYTIEPALKSEV